MPLGCAMSILLVVAQVPPLNRLGHQFLLQSSGAWWVLAAASAVVGFLGSLYFLLAVVLHLVRCSHYGWLGKTIWGICLLFGMSLTAVVYFLTVWPCEDKVLKMYPGGL
jgi:hypothetical protein